MKKTLTLKWHIISVVLIAILFPCVFKSDLLQHLKTFQQYRNRNSNHNSEKGTSLNKSLPPFAKGCQGRIPGDTFECRCGTGTVHMQDDTMVYNECHEGIANGAKHGKQEIEVLGARMGMAVYSPYSRNLCGEGEKGGNQECFCTCFHQASVNGAVGFRTSISAQSILKGHDHELLELQVQPDQQGSNNDGDEDIRNLISQKGFVTDCLGLCGPNCAQGKYGRKYASILIHDICQSFIRSSESMPNANDCSDEGWSALGAALLSVFWNGPCPKFESAVKQ